MGRFHIAAGLETVRCGIQTAINVKSVAIPSNQRVGLIVAWPASGYTALANLYPLFEAVLEKNLCSGAFHECHDRFSQS